MNAQLVELDFIKEHCETSTWLKTLAVSHKLFTNKLRLPSQPQVLLLHLHFPQWSDKACAELS